MLEIFAIRYRAFYQSVADTGGVSGGMRALSPSPALLPALFAGGCGRGRVWSIRFNLDAVACFAFPERINFEMLWKNEKTLDSSRVYHFLAPRDGLEPPT